ncbi:UNVERIFIED_CONTAM: hypothetical protein FKN15_020877 [Acipenser sinensis]
MLLNPKQSGSCCCWSTGPRSVPALNSLYPGDVIRAKVVGGKEVDSGNDIYGNPIKRIQYEIKQLKMFKGPDKLIMAVFTAPSSAVCGVTLETNGKKEYLISGRVTEQYCNSALTALSLTIILKPLQRTAVWGFCSWFSLSTVNAKTTLNYSVCLFKIMWVTILKTLICHLMLLKLSGLVISFFFVKLFLFFYLLL